jgi:hypothetical protein
MVNEQFFLSDITLPRSRGGEKDSKNLFLTDF